MECGLDEHSGMKKLMGFVGGWIKLGWASKYGLVEILGRGIAFGR